MPVSFAGAEMVEAVRFLGGEVDGTDGGEGNAVARRVAEESRRMATGDVEAGGYGGLAFSVVA